MLHQRGDISTLKDGPLKLVDKFPYLGRSVSSTEKDINTRLAKVRTANDSLSVIWMSDLTEFTEFTRKNDSKHQLVSPYHQASNGQAESSVKIFKSGLRRMLDGTLETKPSRFLLSYKTTPHTTTGVTPAERLMERKLQTNLDRLRPSTLTTVLLSHDHHDNRQDVDVS